MRTPRLFSPLTWPVLSFALVIAVGSLGLWIWGSRDGTLAFVDALFIATSAVCVTGLSTVDVGTCLNDFGLGFLLALIQLGGLGITTYTSLLALLWRDRVPLTDRLAVTRALMNKQSFNLKKFLWIMLLTVCSLEAIGAALLMLARPDRFDLFGAVFHSVSAFCNAGFSFFPNNLEDFQGDWAVCLVIMSLIVLGGIGFIILDEARLRLCGRRKRLSRYARLVIATSAFLIFAGAGLIYVVEVLSPDVEDHNPLLVALFQSVSARTAGFNSIPLAGLNDFSLMVIMALMFVGGAPASCAGGIKITSFRVLAGFMQSQCLGRQQIVIAGRAVAQETRVQALSLFFFASLLIAGSTLLLSLTENGLAPHNRAAISLLDLLFEVISAFGTVGLTTGITSTLSDPGKLIIVSNMFIGRVGLIALLAALQSLRRDRRYAYAEGFMPIG